MSIIVSGIHLPINAEDSAAFDPALKKAGLSRKQIKSTQLYKKSIDARKGQIKKICSVIFETNIDEETYVKRSGKSELRYKSPATYPKARGTKKLENRPVIVGFGPAGLFCALILAQNGYRPLVLERGGSIGERDSAVDGFFKGGAFDENSNIQFGEGGAGAYSDGKLTTRIGDGRCELVLNELLRHGAPAEIACLAKPHIGTDLLKQIVVSMRQEICRLGGEVLFHHKLEDIIEKNGSIVAIRAAGAELATDVLVLATGHSARDTFEMLLERGVFMEAKAFSVGARIEHLQETIDKSLYGKFYGAYALPPAEYTLAHRDNDVGRACYSFCMCPGGMVVAAASEVGGVLTNGMSYHARGLQNANSAIVVSVEPRDFSSSPLGGMYFQRELEQRAYQISGSYKAPCQRLGDFMEGRVSRDFGGILPSYPIGTVFSDLNQLLPDFVSQQMKNGLAYFGRKIEGFDGADALLTGPETRTSSPVRITRDDHLDSLRIKGLLPCGEGAGYAGGIMSAAVDGIRVAEEIMGRYQSF